MNISNYSSTLSFLNFLKKSEKQEQSPRLASGLGLKERT